MVRGPTCKTKFAGTYVWMNALWPQSLTYIMSTPHVPRTAHDGPKSKHDGAFSTKNVGVSSSRTSGLVQMKANARGESAKNRPCTNLED